MFHEVYHSDIQEFFNDGEQVFFDKVIECDQNYTKSLNNNNCVCLNSFHVYPLNTFINSHDRSELIDLSKGKMIISDQNGLLIENLVFNVI